MKDAYVHLGIPPTATIEEIETAYATKKRLFDPSRFPEGSPEYEEARRMSTMIEMAYHFAVASYYAPAKKETPAVSFSPPPSVVPSYPKPRKKGISPTLATVLGVIVVLAGIVVLYTSISRSPAPRETKTPAAVQPAAVQTASTSQQPDQTELAGRLLKSTVFVEVGMGDRRTGLGSGFFVNEKGDVLTNYHVVEGVGRILVTFENGDSSWAKVRAFDKVRDIALLALDSPPLTVPFLPRSTTRPKQGESILVAGAPRGYDNTLSNGIVAAVRDMDSNTFVQITAPISPGSSGGPVMNMKGEIIAMSTKIRVDAQNLNFAVASVVFNNFIAYAERQTPLPLPQTNTSTVSAPRTQQKTPARPAEEPTGIPVPSTGGFMGHKWGSSLASLRKRLSKLEPLNQEKFPGTYTTGKFFTAFKSRVDVHVFYGFYKDQLYEITFMKAQHESGAKIQDVYDELVSLYGMEGEEMEIDDVDAEIYTWKTGDLVTFLRGSSANDNFTIEFMYWPLVEQQLNNKR